MKRKFFGQYLVDKQIIDSEVLLSTLVEQLQDVPTVLQVVYDQKLLKPEQILSALAYQTQKKCEFRTACRDLGFWNIELQKGIDNVISEKKIPLGQLLVKSNKVEMQTLISALDEYFDEIKKSGDSDQEDEMEPNTRGLTHDLVAALDDVLDSSKTTEFLEILENAEKGEEVEKAVARLKKDLKTFAGVSRFVGVDLLENIFKLSEKALEEPTSERFKAVREAFDLACGLKESIREHLSEQKFWMTDEKQNSYKQVVSTLKKAA